MSGFSNRLYVGELSRLDRTSSTLTIHPSNPKGRIATGRRVAAFIYELAAELEWLCGEHVANFADRPGPMEGRIVVGTVLEATT